MGQSGSHLFLNYGTRARWNEIFPAIPLTQSESAVDIGVIFREQVQRERPLDAVAAISASDEWSVHHIQSGGVSFDLILARSTPAGLSCGWTKVHGGWTAWVAERTTLLELRRALSATPSMDDADIMRAAIECWGFGAIKHTDSVWAGMIWREHEQELCFFRDRIGMVPTFYSRESSQNSEFGVFSTSVALIQHLYPKSRDINLNRLRKFLLNKSDCRRDDFFEEISRLHPGESWHWRPYKQPPRIERYWHFNNESQRFDDREQLADVLLSRLKNIVGDYFEAKYFPLTLVSGGVDSTLLLSLQIEQQQRLGLGDNRVDAATMGFPSFPTVDESYWVNHLQEHIGHSVATVNVEDKWPMRDPEVFTRYPELGPSFHPGEDYETTFIHRALKEDSSRSVFWGVGADQLFVVNENRILKSLLNSSDVSFDVRLTKAHRRFGTKRIASHLLGRTSAAKPLRILRDKSDSFFGRQANPWHNPERWVSFEATGTVNPSNSNIRDVKPEQSFLSRHLWELVIRGFRRKSLYLGRSHHLPYLRADFVKVVLGRKPHSLHKSATLQKSLLRDIARNYVPESIRLRPKGGVFSKFVESGVGGREYTRIEALFSGESALADNQLIEPKVFLDTFAAYRSFCWSHQGKRQTAAEMILWRTIAGELWCRRVS
ncbi:asparagine synthase-related protein [Bradymonas sediminis]|uniref:asparagine synthase (glutamine-hydrolyzing) n=1 Tax=Bradymonas sediminis TaxID=1548548 RepID=A0A2Z4FGB0_9DELT|nr:asparagine synthase-related protein [Bradymonas sediminis]AWV87973.1 hypothetical protein DN745_00955 [Bradymonas sediminis]TDP62992.1 glutamine amidotransferase-like protein [Bradymonas sediminis]